MFVLGNFLAAAAQIIHVGLTAFTWLVIARVLASWLSPDPFNPIMQFLIQTTDPVLNLFRRWVPPIGFLDISPIVALLVIQFLQAFLVRTLLDLSLRLR